MNEKPTISELLSPAQAQQDYPRMRQVCTEALHPGPWRHDWRWTSLKLDALALCRKCRKRSDEPGKITMAMERENCPIPDPATGPLAEIAAQLVSRCMATDESAGKLGDAMIHRLTPHVSAVFCGATFLAWLRAPATEHIICALLALGKCDMDQEGEK